MAFDFKREYRALYLPKAQPALVTVPQMRYVAVRGRGDPNLPDGDFARAVAALYAVSYAIKMSKRGDRRIEGYYDFVVPPLEGFWQQPGVHGVDYANKDAFQWIACIRLPDFVGRDDFAWALEAAAKKGLACVDAEYLTLEEGLCVQAMHTGSYDDEPVTIARLHAFAAENGYVEDLSPSRRHHEIYLSDPRRTAPEKRKTVIRIPVRKA